MQICICEWLIQNSMFLYSINLKVYGFHDIQWFLHDLPTNLNFIRHGNLLYHNTTYFLHGHQQHSYQAMQPNIVSLCVFRKIPFVASLLFTFWLPCIRQLPYNSIIKQTFQCPVIQIRDKAFICMTNDTETIKLCHEIHLKEILIHEGNTDPTHKTLLFSVTHVSENSQTKWHNTMTHLRTTSNQWKYGSKITQFLCKMTFFLQNPSPHTGTFPWLTYNAGQSRQRRPISLTLYQYSCTNSYRWSCTMLPFISSKVSNSIHIKRCRMPTKTSLCYLILIHILIVCIRQLPQRHHKTNITYAYKCGINKLTQSKSKQSVYDIHISIINSPLWNILSTLSCERNT